MNFAERLKELSERRGLNLTRLVRATGISGGSISKWMNDTTGTHLPTSENLAKLASVLGVTMDELFHGSEKCEGMTLRDDGTTVDAERRRAEAAEAKLDRAKKALRAALAELESGVKY